MALGRALRHEYENKQEEVPEHMRQWSLISKRQESSGQRAAAIEQVRRVADAFGSKRE
jgi:hypothetical protein